jgi:hypothetical protein
MRRAPPRGHVEALVASARRAVYLEGAAIEGCHAVGEALRRAALHDIAQHCSNGVCDRRCKHRLRRHARMVEAGLVRRDLLELQTRDVLRRWRPALVRDNADQLRESHRPITRRADRRPIRRRQPCERMAERAPRLADLRELLQLNHALDATVLRRVVARLEEPMSRPWRASRLGRAPRLGSTTSRPIAGHGRQSAHFRPFTREFG